MIWLLAPHSLRKVRLCCRWLVSHHSMKGSNLIVVHRRVEITASLLNFRSLRGAQYLSDCSTALWKFPYTTQSNRSSFFFFFLQSSHLFMAFFIFSTLPSPYPLLMHFFLSIFSVTMTLQFAIFTLSKYDESFSSVLLGFCLSRLFVDVVCISETRGVCAAKVVKNRSRKQKTPGCNEGLCAWLMLGISGANRC